METIYFQYPRKSDNKIINYKVNFLTSEEYNDRRMFKDANELNVSIDHMYKGLFISSCDPAIKPNDAILRLLQNEYAKLHQEYTPTPIKTDIFAKSKRFFLRLFNIIK